MLKVPTMQCSFEHHKTTRTVFVPKHEVPLWRFRAVRNKVAPQVQRPEGGLPAPMYWFEFHSVDAEYQRLCRVYTNEVVQREYPSVDDLRAVLDLQLDQVAKSEGVSPDANDIKPEPILVDLLKAAEVAEDKCKEAAIDLTKKGFVTVDDIADASMSKLCEVRHVGPAKAHNLINAAKELQEQNAKVDADVKADLLAGKGLVSLGTVDLGND